MYKLHFLRFEKPFLLLIVVKNFGLLGWNNLFSSALLMVVQSFATTSPLIKKKSKI